MISIEQARQYYRNDAAHDFDHVLRVLANAREIAATETDVDLDVLTTAVLLHDIARAEQDRTGVDHALAGAEQARRILTDADPDFVAAVCHAIAAHRFRNDMPPQSPEARILYDADKLDSLGAIGVARIFAYAGHHRNRLWAEDDSGAHTPLQEYRQKLQHLPDKLLTPSGRKLARTRHAFMAAFLEQMAAEIAGTA